MSMIARSRLSTTGAVVRCFFLGREKIAHINLQDGGHLGQFLHLHTGTVAPLWQKRHTKVANLKEEARTIIRNSEIGGHKA